MSKLKKNRGSTAMRFFVGDRIRVKQGVKDSDYPDLPLGGWAGTISEVRKNRLCTIRWSRETLDAIHPVYKSRCERDGTDCQNLLAPTGFEPAMLAGK